MGRRELRATGKDFGQHLFPRFPRASVGVTHDPPGDLSESWWRGPDDMDPTSALWPQIVANDLVTAMLAVTLELGVEMDRVGDSVCPAFVQVGLVGASRLGRDCRRPPSNFSGVAARAHRRTVFPHVCARTER